MHKRSFPDHTADIALRVEAPSLDELFEGFAMGFREAIVEGLATEVETQVEMEFAENSREELLVRFLDELNYMFTVKKRVVKTVQQCEVLSNGEAASLKAVIGFEPFDPSRHEALNEIKAVTFHQLNVIYTGESWTAAVVFDI